MPHHINDKFNQKMVEYDEFNTVPLFMHDNYVFFFIKHENITILAVSTRNSNAMMIFSFLHELKKIWIEYFKNLEAESVKDNMIMIYELLDEIMDNGYPQSTEIKSLKKMIKTKHHELKKDNKNSKKNKNEANQMASSLSSNIPWRPGTYKYNRNEAYLDVIEKVNMLVGHNGQVIRSEVEGKLHMRCYLSGMPELVLCLNDKKFFDMSGRTTRRRVVDIEDIKFHQCVRLGVFENERTISFIPPDGEFDLINYRMESAYKPLFTVFIKIETETDTKLVFTVQAKTHYRDKIMASFVEILIPVPPDSQNVKSKSSSGHLKYQPDQDCISWKLKQLYGKKEVNMKCQ